MRVVVARLEVRGRSECQCSRTVAGFSSHDLRVVDVARRMER